jgi:hypothetical protein
MADSYWTLDGFIDAFVAALRARAGLAGKQIEDSWPGEEAEQQTIWIEDASSTEEVAGMRAGPIKNNEVYTVGVICDVYVEGGTTKAARDLLTPLVGEVMREVAESKRGYTTSNGAICGARISGWKYRPYVQKEGRGVACRVEVKVSGRR